MAQGKADTNRISHFPSFRTTGASLTVQIMYTNTDTNGNAMWQNPEVKATVKSTVQTGAWSSVGGTTKKATVIVVVLVAAGLVGSDMYLR